MPTLMDDRRPGRGVSIVWSFLYASKSNQVVQNAALTPEKQHTTSTNCHKTCDVTRLQILWCFKATFHDKLQQIQAMHIVTVHTNFFENRYMHFKSTTWTKNVEWSSTSSVLTPFILYSVHCTWFNFRFLCWIKFCGEVKWTRMDTQNHTSLMAVLVRLVSVWQTAMWEDS